MVKSTLTLFYAGLCCVLMVGCNFAVKDRDLVDASYVAADVLVGNIKDIRMLGNVRQNDFYPTKPILIASFVNIDNVQQSSTFGRMVAEQIGSRIAQHGYKVIEMKLRTNSVFIQTQNGEFLLSRELHKISHQHDAYAVVVGTYGASKEIVYVTAKLIRVQDSVILSSYDYSLPVGEDTKRLLRKGRR